jgi:hypothetical protein
VNIALQRAVVAPMSHSSNLMSMITVGLREVGARQRKPVDILPEIDIPVDF